MTRAWHAFFGLVSVVIIVTMMLPHAFGLEGYTQWGGMYVDGWCNVVISRERLEDVPDAETYEIREDQHNVWYTPMHSPRSCVAWARSWCTNVAPNGWTVAAAYAYHRGTYLADSADVCSLPDDPTFRWYRR